MRTRRLFRAADVSALTGLSTSLVQKWERAGILKGQRTGEPGQNREVLFSEEAVFAAAACRSYGNQGLTLSHIRPKAEFLNALTIEQIEEAAEANKILVSAGAALSPRFIDFTAEALGRAAAEASKFGTNEVLVSMSMAAAWNKFQAGMKHFEQYVAAPLN